MIGRKKKPSGHGAGKWHNGDAIERYRSKRNERNKAQRRARARNRR